MVNSHEKETATLMVSRIHSKGPVVSLHNSGGEAGDAGARQVHTFLLWVPLIMWVSCHAEYGLQYKDIYFSFNQTPKYTFIC